MASERGTAERRARKGPNPLILMVDDDTYLVRAIEFMLKDNHFRCASAPTGEAALGAIERLHPDAIYLDLLLPDMNGFDLISRIRQISAVPIIVLSAVPGTATSNKVKAISLGANDFLSKPFDEDELMGKTRALLRRPA